MPRVGAIALRYREEGIQQAGSFLSTACGARRLSEAEVQSLKGRSLLAGWELALQTPLSTRRVHLCVDGQFPFSIPHFFLIDRPEFLTWPHIEEDGLLCLLTGAAVSKFRQPADVIGELLGDAYRLICESESGANEQDFRSEFYSYWNRSLPEEKQRIHSLLAVDGRSRLVHIWRGETRPIVGEAEDQVLAWLRHSHGAKPQFDTTDIACLLWLPEPFLPREYPKSAADLYRLSNSIDGGKELLEKFSKLGKSPYYFILAAESGNGPCLAGVMTKKPMATDIRGKRWDFTSRGFRPGKVPLFLATQRLFSSDSPATRIRIERVDPAWIHGRGHDPRQGTLFSQRVVLIGCGSVGAPLAQQLAMAGVGCLTLVDPEELTWANVGRHPLGAECVGENKAEALADRLQKSYPHLEIKGFDFTYEDFAAQQPQLLEDGDLIICATASWKMEGVLNLQQVEGEIVQPVLYTWTEPHACAGHAVLIHSEAPCLQCGMTLSGKIRKTVTTWPRDKETRSEPACGAVFQPYGPIELMGTISVAASLALDSLLGKAPTATHRIWAGTQSLLEEAGGNWSDTWLKEDPSRAKGGFQEDCHWERDSLCPVCRGCDTSVVLPSPLVNPDNASSLPTTS